MPAVSRQSDNWLWSVVLAGAGAALLVCTPALALSSDAPRKSSSIPDWPAPVIELKSRVWVPDPHTTDLPPTDRAPYCIIELSGPVQAGWRTELQAVGAALLDYLPRFSFIARCSPAARQRASALPFVRWIGALPREDRLSPSLPESGAIEAVISLFPSESPAELVRVCRLAGIAATPVGAALVWAAGDAGAIRALADRPAVRWIERRPHIRFLMDRALPLVGAPTIWHDLALTGLGQIVGLVDTGLENGDAHGLSPSFKGRVWSATGLGIPDDWADRVGHGTHVAGAIAASPRTRARASSASLDPLLPPVMGVAPGARLIIQAVNVDPLTGLETGLPDDITNMLQPAYDQGARIHNDSWGDDGTPRGDYTLHCQEVDDFIWMHPDLSVLFAAGNDGAETPTDADPTLTRIALGSLYAPGTAKDCITVGASENDRPSSLSFSGLQPRTWGDFGFSGQPIHSDPVSDNPEGMAAFSSRGPTGDGRLKPDLVAPGTDLLSTRSTLAPDSAYWDVTGPFAYMGGTSMSCAIVSGGAALFRQWWARSHSAGASAALVRAALTNSAHDMNPGQYGAGAAQEMGPRPNPVEGWGRLDLRAAMAPGLGSRLVGWDSQRWMQTGDVSRQVVRVVSSTRPLRVTLAWSDPGATPSAAVALVNDLDLQVTARDGTVFAGNGAADHLNNLEGVDIASPAPGVYRIGVTGANVPLGPQPFALVASGDLAPVATGDVNGDGRVSAADAVLALKGAAGLVALTPLQSQAADLAPLGGDSAVTMADVAAILRLIAGLDPA